MSKGLQILHSLNELTSGFGTARIIGCFHMQLLDPTKIEVQWQFLILCTILEKIHFRLIDSSFNFGYLVVENKMPTGVVTKNVLQAD